MSRQSRHEVDPHTQGAMFSSPQELAGGAVVEVEGSFYQVSQPEAGSEPGATSPEQQLITALKAEDIALDFLDRAATTATRVSNMSRGQYALRHAGVDQTEQSRLGLNIEISKATERRFRRIAKAQFARSIDIETEEKESVEFIEAEGQERKVIRVVAKNPERQAELSHKYKGFLDAYRDKPKARIARRREIARWIETHEPAAA